MRWIVGALAMATILLSASQLYLSYAVSLPDLVEIGVPADEAPDMKLIALCMAAKEVIAICTGVAALVYAFGARSLHDHVAL